MKFIHPAIAVVEREIMLWNNDADQRRLQAMEIVRCLIETGHISGRLDAGVPILPPERTE